MQINIHIASVAKVTPQGYQVTNAQPLCGIHLKYPFVSGLYPAFNDVTCKKCKKRFAKQYGAQITA